MRRRLELPATGYPATVLRRLGAAEVGILTAEGRASDGYRCVRWYAKKGDKIYGLYGT